MKSEELKAQATQLTAYEAKRAKMLEEYNHYFTFRVDPLPITKISYRIDNTAKQASMRITRDNHKIPVDQDTARKLGIPLPPELSALGVSTTKKKRKRSSEILKEVFIKEDIVVDGMHKNLVPPPGVEGSRGLVITKPESRIFFYNGNFDLRGTPKAEERYKKIELAIEARNDVSQARKIVKENLDGMGQYILAECKASANSEGLAESKASVSNLRRIQVKDIVKEVEDYLKTYSSAGMDISWEPILVLELWIERTSTKKLNEKEIMYMRYRDEAKSLKMEDKALKQLRRTLVPYARLMPNFNKPFLPRKSSKGFTKPRSPRRSLKEHKEERWWWLQQHQVQPQI
ncbi:retrovirus-related pol polyprotein from transposon TNT 1-94 [Tanacetum coccineum]